MAFPNRITESVAQIKTEWNWLVARLNGIKLSQVIRGMMRVLPSIGFTNLHGCLIFPPALDPNS
jgi:hypothetical protein